MAQSIVQIVNVCKSPEADVQTEKLLKKSALHIVAMRR
jgi:hypothetical protein